MQNTADMSKLGQCMDLEELQTPEKETNAKTGEECAKDGTVEHFCSIPDVGQKLKDRIRSDVSMCGGASAKAAELQERNPQYYFAQRFIDTSNCKDLVGMIPGPGLVAAKQKQKEEEHDGKEMEKQPVEDLPAENAPTGAFSPE
jgi:hypothetical protein